MAMAELSKAEKFALDAVAKHFSTTWQSGDGPPHGSMTLGGGQVTLDVAVLTQHLEEKRAGKARLREDKVARRVLSDIENALRAYMPDGQTLVFTLGAPIKVPKLLVTTLTNTVLAYLASGAAEADEHETILGNRVRFRLLSNTSKWKTRVIGFVFSGDPELGFLATALRSLHAAIAAKAKARRPQGSAGERWLVLSNAHWIADGKTYRQAYSQMSPSHDFGKILMVLEDGRVESLAERRSR